MKSGYSNLLGEIVSAEEVEPRDMAGFQIVCPHCRDPIFKVSRPIADDRKSEFFSHYEAKAGFEDCELRVGGMSQDDVSRQNAIARGQNLKVFLSVFRDALKLMPALEEARDRMSRVQPRGRDLVIQVFAECIEGAVDSDIEYDLDVAARLFDMQDLKIKTGLGFAFRRRAVLDIFRHLRAPHAQKSRHALATRILEQVFENELRTGGNTRTVAAIGPLLQALRSGLHPAEFGRRVPGFGESLDASFVGSRGIVVGMILRLPFTKMLENHRAGRSPLFQIEQLDDLSLNEETVSEILATVGGEEGSTSFAP